MRSDVNERIKDLVVAGLLICVAIGGFVFVNPKGAAITEGPGGLSWRSLPFIYSGLLLALAAVYAGTSLIALLRARSDPGPAVALSPADLSHARVSDRRRLATVACLVAYVVVLPLFGFALTTPILLFVLFFVFGRTNIPQNLQLAVIGGALLWLLFVGALKLPLRGSLWDPVTPYLSNLLRSVGL